MTQLTRRSQVLSNQTGSEVLYSQTLPVRIRPLDRDEYSSHLTVKIGQIHTNDARGNTGGIVLTFEVTDPSDPFFLYTLKVSEADFHCLKTDQRLLVDFQAFPAMVQKLMSECSTSSNMASNLTVDDTDFATISIVEANQFRELTHFALRLRRGNDEAVKTYLAGRLTHFRTAAASVEEKLRITEDELRRSHQLRESTSHQLAALQHELDQALRSERASHAREIAELRETQARELRALHEHSTAERATEARQLREALRLAEARAVAAERVAEELRAGLSTVEAELGQTRRRCGQQESELAATHRSLDESRAGNRSLEADKHKLEKKTAELTVEVSGLRENLTSREKLAANSNALAEHAISQKKNLEEQISALRSQLGAAEGRAADAAEAANRAHAKVEELDGNLKSQKAKTKLKVTALHQQEAAIQEFEKKVAELQREVSTAKEISERHREAGDNLQREVEATNAKLHEAHNLLQSNEQVIAYLNKQLTDREVRTFGSAAPTPNSIAMQLGSKLRQQPPVKAASSVKALPDFPLRSAAPSLLTAPEDEEQNSRVAPVKFTPRLPRAVFE